MRLTRYLLRYRGYMCISWEDSNARFVPDPAEEEAKPPDYWWKWSLLILLWFWFHLGDRRYVSIVRRPTQAPMTVGLALKRNETRQLPLMGHQTAKNRTTVQGSAPLPYGCHDSDGQLPLTHQD
ncbi:hypothetical protein T12_4801 [Trichinella patagoniensis]|uniref:Uncharacterized protein n=1 Tax=Trichinella patagoniensis TaxID=990121 RepID=A0A0V1A2J2_9BILA|nr:hypothetical protein T12_4801 [Trichinella patagoniensis]